MFGLLIAVIFGLAMETRAAEFQALVFSKTAGFRHTSQIAAGQTLIQDLGNANNFHVEFTEDGNEFHGDTLPQYAVVVFLNTSRDVLSGDQEAAFEQYMANGGGYVGIHSASATEYDWDFYGDLVGAYFDDHPAQQTATVHLANGTHVSTSHLEESFQHFDEWYNFQVDVTDPNFRINPADNPNITVLLNLDETTYNGGTMGEPHPISWYQEFGGGRSCYTAMGHSVDTYTESFFIEHVRGGILYAAGSFLVLGDMDCDGDIDFDDIGPFVLGLTDPEAYESAFGVLPVVKGDINLDGRHDFDNIVDFVALISSGSDDGLAVVPEPSGIALFTLAFLGEIGRTWRKRHAPQ